MSTLAFSRTRRPIGGSAGSRRVGRVVARRVDVRPPRARRREAERVVDHAARDLVVAREAGEDRQPGGVGRRPARGPQLVRAQAPDRARAGRPAAPRVAQRRTARRACRCSCRRASACRSPSRRAALDVDASRDRVAHPVGLVRVLERHASAASARETTSNGMPIGPPSHLPEPKSACSRRVERRSSAISACGVGGDRQRVDALVPRVDRGKDRAARRRRQRSACADDAASSATARPATHARRLTASDRLRGSRLNGDRDSAPRTSSMNAASCSASCGIRRSRARSRRSARPSARG